MNAQIKEVSQQITYELGYEDLSDFAERFCNYLAERWAAKCEAMAADRQTGPWECAAMIREDVKS